MSIQKYRPAKRTPVEKESTIDRLHTYLALDNEEEAEHYLTEHEEKVLARYFSISALSDRGMPTEKMIRKHCKKYNLHRSTAFRDLTNSQELFGNASQVSKQAKRYAVEQLARRGYEQAEIMEDARAMAQQVRNMIMINRLDQDDSNAVDPTRIQPPTLVLQVSLPEGKAATFDVNKLKDIKDISYEDVLEGYEEGQRSDRQMEKYLDELESERE
ncbi:hypothetical protein [uncultured Pontibacter sp.]|uniref:hypothetical protein n=1 Tax=uncultured Pontibacter sp. TaxID=453356 RepID=UPI00261764AB|nr:hypothetical protein [uncultured Pontibacter sp.]